ncbi:GntR family transcriptional regulator [Amycolatopsis sp. FDAARGOS 1241]|uniref:GntR family transcriptional regulator n=1 Tax=Amycolatopsis sp. FDAARGOS 1241 TaxID=2778070 RepID=UPI00194FEF6F|nr:GntR family transcriptional regulator [Amycolatopsis sp. FDAARGOS 1241]QRP47715.1 GntR family transcriptional regulator [Amycolatopsis sp. FDAARGOS 1241]
MEQTPTPLTRQVAARIVGYIRETAAEPGTRLVERTLAAHLRVSRSPVRAALKLLADEGVVAVAEPGGGHTVARPVDELTVTEDDEDEEQYLRIASDRLDGELPDRVSESELARRYGLTPAQVTGVLRRISAEGWIERLPGYGWEFQPMLTSQESYEDSYRFRLVLEPAAVLEPGFVVDRAAIEVVRAQQLELAEGAARTVSGTELFGHNRAFHEAVVNCSRNTFFIDALRRVDNLRRLIEYRRTLPRDRAAVRCREHVEIADLLLAGEIAEAAEYLRRHLSTVSVEKTANPR